MLSSHLRRDTSKNRVRPRLEALEDRLTPSSSPATAVVSGHVFAGGTAGLPGVDVTLTGTTTTGRTVDISTTTDSGGAYAFTHVLPGTYSLSRGGAPDGFVDGGSASLSGIVVSSGAVTADLNIPVLGLTASKVSLAFFLSDSVATQQVATPAPGAGSASTFSLDSVNPLTDQFVVQGSTTFLDLSGNFFDPDTTDTFVTFNTSQGSFNVELFDKDAPQTVANFLNYIQAGDYNNDLLQRLSNLSQTFAQTPAITPLQVLQAGGFTVNTGTGDSVTGFTPLTTFQAIQNEFSALHPNVAGTLSMARSSDPNSATSQFFFNLTDNSQTLGSGNAFAVFGQVVSAADTATLQKFTTQYTPTDETLVNSNFFTLPLLKGFSPSANFPAGATKNDLAVINSITTVAPPTGHLTYAVVGNSNPSVVTATLGSNTSTSTFSANQLKLVAGNTPGTSVITLLITDNRGESVTKQFTVTVA
jgi:peptidyl-prolyl cis-trans isomerase A (cyclophilin A)